MIAKMADVKVTMLAWLPVPPHGPRPPEGTCLFSDGVQFWAGWWHEDGIMVSIMGGAIAVPIKPSTRSHLRWAKLNNLVKIFDGAVA